MGPMGGAASMPTSVLPGWMRVLWVAVLLGAAARHLQHGRRARGRARWWHTGHTTMAVGMALMYLVDRTRAAAVNQALLVVFAVLALSAVIAVLRRPEGLLDLLWWGGTLDLLAMVYMVLPAQERTSLATGVVLTYLGVQVLACARGRWFPPAVGGRARAGAKALAAATVPWSTGLAAAAVPMGRSLPHGAGQLSGCRTAGTRAGLAAVAASMGYMLAVM